MALSQNANLTVLKLGYNNLGDDGVATLAAGVAIHKSLILLDLGFNNFGDDGAKALAMAMQEASKRYNGGSLRTLYLAGNFIGEDGALAIADFIRQGSRLCKLYMTGNRIGADGVKAITEAILEDEVRRGEGITTVDAENPAIDFGNVKKSPALSSTSFQGMQELFFGGTGMGTQGCQAVSRLLQKSSCLRVISLPNCDMGDEEVGMLASSIKTNKGRLPVESIQLSFNTITHKGLESLTNAVWGSTSLRELRLDNNEIGDRGAHQVAAFLPALKALEILDVGFNSIKASGLNVLMKSVAESEQLLSLSVSGNAIDVPSAKAVAYALAYNRSLQSLFLVHCTINHEGQRHISAGIVSNSKLALRKLTGFDVGRKYLCAEEDSIIVYCLFLLFLCHSCAAVIVTLGFPEALKHWSNEQVLNFIHLMWDKEKGEEPQSELEYELDPLNFLPDSASERSTTDRPQPLEASVVVEVAKKAYESLVANGVDVFTRRSGNKLDPSFGSPLAGDAIMIESASDVTRPPSNPCIIEDSSNSAAMGWEEQMPSNMARSFVAPPESNNSSKKQEMPDPARKQLIVEWLCSNIQHLNELSQLSFSSRELWRLHQHYFTPVVNESGGSVCYADPGSLIISSVPEVSRGNPGGSTVTPSTHSSEDQMLSVPVGDPVFPGSPSPTSLPMLKRKVSYRLLGDAMHSIINAKNEPKLGHNHKNGSVARMIEEGHTGHSLPPKTKRARRNRTRISFLPRIKVKLDSYLDVCHEKALITMRQLYFIEQAILGGQVNPLGPSPSPRTHLSGTLASEAEMIIVDMI